MQQQRDGIRKPYTYKLMPTPQQERAIESVVWRCRELYNAGLHERKAAGEPQGGAVPFARQSAHVPASKEVRPDDHDRTAPVVQAVLHRLDRAFAAGFRRRQAGEQPGYPRYQGTDRPSSFT